MQKIIEQQLKKTKIQRDPGTKVMKQVRSYESRLEAMKKNSNQAQSEIRLLQVEVNTMRRERVIFDNVFEKIEQDIKRKEVILQSYLLKTIDIENERNTVIEQLNNVKKETMKEQQDFQAKSEASQQKNEVNHIDIRENNNNKIMITNQNTTSPKRFDSNNERYEKQNEHQKQFKADSKKVSLQYQLEQIKTIFDYLIKESNITNIDQLIEHIETKKYDKMKLEVQSTELQNQHE